MGRLKVLGAVGAVALMVGALAPNSASAQEYVRAFSSLETTNLALTDADGNKLSSDFFQSFDATVTLDPRARLRGVTDDPDTLLEFNKEGFEQLPAPVPQTTLDAFLGDGTDFDNPGMEFSRGRAQTEGNFLNRPGQDDPDARGLTIAESQITDEGRGSADSQVLTQVFDFAIAPTDQLQAGSEVEIRLTFDALLQLVTEEVGLVGISPWEANSSFSVSARDVTAGADVTLNELIGDIGDDLNRNVAVGGEFGPTATEHLIAGSFVVGNTHRLSLNQQVDVAARVAEDVPVDIPAPATMLLLGTGLLGLGLASMQSVRRRRNAA